MDVREYIESGIVEMYATGALNQTDSADFEQKALMYPEIRQELLRIQGAWEKFASAYARNPRPAARERILGTFAEEKNDKPAKKKSSDKTPEEKHYLTYKYLIAASLAALVVSTFASWFFYSRSNEAEDRYTQSLKDKKLLAQNYNVVKGEFDKNLATLIILRDPAAPVFELDPSDTSGHFLARIYWDPSSALSYVDILGIPAPEYGRVFQVWAVKGKTYTDAGVIEYSIDGVQRLKDIREADQWIITQEPLAGSTQPSLDHLFMRSR